jgi:hypothetical protein
MLKRILSGIVIAVMMTNGATAEPALLLSSGRQPCGDFVAALPQSQQIFEAWAVGFISGQNSTDVGAMRSAGSGWTPDSVMVWLKGYCSEHPLAPFVEAVDKLRQELAAQEGRLPK